MAGLSLPALLAAPFGAALAAGPTIELTLAYFSSDRTTTYTGGIQPFVEAVNALAAGTVRIAPRTGGVLGRDPAKQLDLVVDGMADLALVLPGATPDRFPGIGVIQLPGLFDDVREASLVFARMASERAFRPGEDLMIVAAFATAPESLHLRQPAASLDDLRGRRIRVDNPLQGRALARLGMVPVPMAVNGATAALGAGEIDGVLASPAPLIDFGIARVTANHYLLAAGAVPLLIVMKRSRFEALPVPAQDAIRAFGGAWTADRFIESQERATAAALAGLAGNSRRRVVQPTAGDLARADAAFSAVADAWAAELPRQAELLQRARRGVSSLRANAAAAAAAAGR